MGKSFFLLLQLFAVAFTLCNYNSGFVMLNISSLLYFSFHMLYIKKNINVHNAEITKYHKTRVKWYRMFLIVYSLFTIFLIFRVIIFSIHFSILWWVGAVSIMVYCQSITISSVVAFGEKGYVSGDFFVRYCDIDEVHEERNMNSWQGEIILITFWKNSRKIGFDKMFMEEYHKLRLQIYQNREAFDK